MSKQIHRIIFLALILAPASHILCKPPKSWWRTMRDILRPVLSERNLENWNRQIMLAEGTLEEDLIQVNNAKSKKKNTKEPVTSFADVAGGVPQEIANLLELIKNTDRYKKFNIAH